MLLKWLSQPASSTAKASTGLFAINPRPETAILASRPRLRQPRPRSITPVRHATHAAQGRANGPKNGPGKRLGAKVTGDSYVIPGHIIFRQRGTLWHPGHNTARARDHSIYATESGYVKYYRDPAAHPKRQYIGVVFDKADTLPVAPHAARQRRLNMIAVPRGSGDGNDSAAAGPPPATAQLTRAQAKEAKRKAAFGRLPPEQLTARGSGYGFRESNWAIGRAAERAGVAVKVFEKGDRFLAWRRRKARSVRIAEKRGMGGQKKPKGKGR